jgi:MFS family permease
MARVMTRRSGSVSVECSVAKNGHYAWYVAILLSCTHMVSFLDRFVMGLVMVPVKLSFGLSDTQLGLLNGTGFVILYTLAALPLGRLADRSNRRNIIIIGILLWSIATAACGLTNSFGSLFAARVGVGFGEASLLPSAMSLLAAYFSRKQLGRAVATFTMGASLGTSLAFMGGGAILAWLVTRGGMNLAYFGHLSPWKALFVFTSLPGLMLAVLLFTVREPERICDVSQARPSVREAFRYINNRRKAYGWHSIASVATIIIIQAVTAWAATFYVRMFGFTPAEAGIAVGSVLLVAAPLGHLSGGWLMDEIHRRGISSAPGLVIALMLTLAVIPGIIFCTTVNITISLAAFAVMKFFLTAAAPPSLAGVQMITPERLRGLMTACFLATVTLIAVGFGPVLVGIITDKVFGYDKALPWSLLILIVGFAVLGVVAAWRSRKPFGAATVDI